ncbi:MAG: TonB-dependent receptor [Steroidobacteraceae bacterium]
MALRKRLGGALPGLALMWASTLAMAAGRDFNIAAAPANVGVTRFAQQAGLPVLFPYELLRERQTQPLQGHYEVEDGLRELLRGSGLTAYVNSRGQLSVRLAEPPRAAATAANADPLAQGLDPLEPGDTLPEIAVTGSRIVRNGMTTPTPLAILSREELQATAPTALIDALAQLPHFLNNDTPQTQSFGSTGAAGASYLNLRGMGAGRTLTLLDGRRTVPASRLGTVDIALFPKNLLQRVEVVTGGASASYGSDAVSGVVNMILDTDFRGMRSHAQAGMSERGDYGNMEASVAYGTRVGEQSSLLLAAELFSSEGIRGYGSRGWYHSAAAITNPDPAGPREIIARDVHATGYTYGGLITSGPLAGTQFLPGGATAPFTRGALYTNVTQSGGDGADQAEDQVWILPDQQRLSAFARLTTQPSASTSAFAQVLAGRTENSFAKDLPAFWGPWEATIYADNAFLPASVGTQMRSLDVDSFRMGRVVTNGELGNPMSRQTGELLSLTAGGDWHFADWSVDGYYQYGSNRTRLDYEEVVRIDRLYRAVDAVLDPRTGQPTCRSTLSFPGDGCVPLDLFGQGSVSPAARAWVMEGSTAHTQHLTEQTAELTLNGDLGWRLAAPVSVAAGVAWRREAVASHPLRYPASLDDLVVEPAATQGYRGLPAAYVGANIFERTTRVQVRGGYGVSEAFGELALPLLRNQPFARRLDLHGAIRAADYSGSGVVTAWKLGVDWQLLESLRLRGTRSRDVRAGSLSERYDVSRSGQTITDRVLPDAPMYAAVIERRGNPAIDPELSDTTTGGVVWQPGWLPEFSLSADYYDIRVHGAIATWGAQTIIDRCADGDADLCALLERDGSTGQITLVNNLVLNIAAARTRGLDVETAWRRPVDWFGGGESFAVRLMANRSFESSTTDARGTRIDRNGQTGLFGGAPRFQANLSLAYERGPLQLMLQERFTSSGSYDATYGPSDINDRHVRAMAVTALQLNWQPDTRRELRLFLNVQNVFDADPPIAPDWGFAGSLPTNEGLFDVLGRRYVVGLRFER